MKPITRGSMKPTTPEAEAAFALYFELITGASVAHEAGDLRGELVILSHALHVLSEGVIKGTIARPNEPLMHELHELYDGVQSLRDLLGPQLLRETRGGNA